MNVSETTLISNEEKDHGANLLALMLGGKDYLQNEERKRVQAIRVRDVARAELAVRLAPR